MGYKPLAVMYREFVYFLQYLQVHVMSILVKYCIVSIHLYSASHSMSLSESIPITALILCRSLDAEVLQAIASEGFAQGTYVAARVRFDPATLRTKGAELTTEPPRPTSKAKQL